MTKLQTSSVGKAGGKNKGQSTKQKAPHFVLFCFVLFPMVPHQFSSLTEQHIPWLTGLSSLPMLPIEPSHPQEVIFVSHLTVKRKTSLISFLLSSHTPRRQSKDSPCVLCQPTCRRTLTGLHLPVFSLRSRPYFNRCGLQLTEGLVCHSVTSPTASALGFCSLVRSWVTSVGETWWHSTLRDPVRWWTEASHRGLASWCCHPASPQRLSHSQHPSLAKICYPKH